MSLYRVFAMLLKASRVPKALIRNGGSMPMHEPRINWRRIRSRACCDSYRGPFGTVLMTVTARGLHVQRKVVLCPTYRGSESRRRIWYRAYSSTGGVALLADIDDKLSSLLKCHLGSLPTSVTPRLPAHFRRVVSIRRIPRRHPVRRVGALNILFCVNSRFLQIGDQKYSLTG